LHNQTHNECYLKNITSKESVTTRNTYSLQPALCTSHHTEFHVSKYEGSSVTEQNFCAMNVCCFNKNYQKKKHDWTLTVRLEK
jgi:hypothetical protein